jgi:hypothetical protein
MADPVGAMRSIYERLQLEWPDDHDPVIKGYLTSKPKDRHGAHMYSLADVGLDPESVRRSFEPYVAHYRIAHD